MRAANIAIPIQADERIQVVDVLRGFAILGILLFNMKSFSGQSFSASSWNEPLDRTIVNLIDLFVQAKFYSLFSFLFGWGMAMQLERAQARNIKFIPFYMRRLIILFIFGGIHSIFLWTGDILTMYSLLGMVLLLLFSKRSGKVLLIAFAVSLLSAIVMTLPGAAMDGVRIWCRSTVECLRPDNPLPGSLYVTGNYFEVTQLRFQEYLGGFWWVPCYFGTVFAMMLLGLYVGKRKIFENIQSHLSMIRRTMWIGLGIGLPLNGLFVYGTLHPFSTQYASLIRIGARTLGAPALTLFYITAIILVFQKESGRQRLASLSFVGRMALSNYITHSIIGPLIFYGYGLGLYGETDPTFGLILTIIIYLAQIRLSQWWFEHFQYGPLEWLWRTLSYATQQPFSVKSSYESLKNLSPRVRRQRTLAVITISIFVLGGITIFANKLNKNSIENAELDSLPGDVTAVDTQTQPDNVTDADESIQFETPFIQPVNVIPGPIAAAGDLQALSETFNAEAAFEHIEILANESYQGRYSGSTMGHSAGNYVAEQFARFGLQPVGDNGSYFQSFPVSTLQMNSMPYLGIIDQFGTLHDNFQLYRDFKPVIGAFAGPGIGKGKVIWVVDCTSNDFRELNVVGKVVFCRDGDTESSSRLAVDNGATGLLLLTDPSEQPPDYRDVPLPAWIPEPIPVFRIYPSTAQILLAGSGYSIADLSITFEPIELKTQIHMEMSVEELCDNEGCLGRNVLGVIPGRDPAYSDQVIIVSANYDGIGRFPDGVFVPGANENASGVAVLLEIARSWQEQAFVPRVTTLFITWDAKEMDSVGAQYYIENPKFALEKTIAVIELDKVGAGGENIQIDGTGFADQIVAIAKQMNIESTVADEFTGDHRSFIDAGVSAHALSWTGDENSSHLPTDTLEIIQLEKLQNAGQLTDLLVLSLAEGKAGINEMLIHRADAVLNGNLTEFLGTSTLRQKANDEQWFRDTQLLKPISCEFVATDVQTEGNTAYASIKIHIEFSTENDDQTKTLTAGMSVMFHHGENGWQWDGPNLVTADKVTVEQTHFTFHYPAERADDLEDLGQRAAEEYIQIANVLSLQTNIDVNFYLYPKSENLRADTSLLQVESGTKWITQNTIKITDSPVIGQAQYLQPLLTQLVLANTGIPRISFPWLQEGLPLVLEGKKDPIDIQSRMLPLLQATLSKNDDSAFTIETSWAKVEYLRQKLGWDGLGRFIIRLGQACQNLDCESGAGENQALVTAFNMDSMTFNLAWRQYWLTKLDKAKSGLDDVLAKRTNAVLIMDETAFLDTVDRKVPNLLNEEKGWFADLSTYPLETFKLTAETLAFLEDGSILASVKMEYQLENISATWGKANLPLLIQFTPINSDYLWAGPMMHTISVDRIRVRYPDNQEEIAEVLLTDAVNYYAQLAKEMNISNPQRMTINLYNDKFIYRSSIALSFSAPEWAPGWSAQGHSIKLLISNDENAETFRPALVEHLSRQLIRQMGVEDEWLLTGASAYLSRNIGGGDMQRKAAGNLSPLSRAVRGNVEFDLIQFPSLYRLSEDDYKVALSQAWDSIRYLAEAHGQDALLDLIITQGNSSNMDNAMLSATGLTTLEFAAVWKDSFSNGHLAPSSMEMESNFNVDNAQKHIAFLTRPDLAGRQAGSTGSDVAATYIAENFTASGLLVEQQYFPVTYQMYLETPVLDLVIGNGTHIESFAHREDFLVLQNVTTNGMLSAGLVWVADEYYTNMNLDGKIVVRKPSLPIEEEIANAVQHGASSLILVGDKNRNNELFAKYPFAPSTSPDAIPVFELTRKGFNRLLELTGQSQESLFNGLPATFLNTKAKIKISLSDSQINETSNIIGLLPGTDLDLQNEYIIIGAHYDHVGDELDTAYRGVNDDTSGVATLLEIARLWRESDYRPRRSVLFVAWGAQELGELGSQYFIENPPFPLGNMVAMIQLDAVGGGSGYYLEAQGVRSEDGILLFSIQKASEITGGRLQVSLPDVHPMTDLDELFSPSRLFNNSIMVTTSDDNTFRQAGIPSLLLRWQKASENNLPDEFADKVLPERLGAAGRMITLALMMIAQ